MPQQLRLHSQWHIKSKVLLQGRFLAFVHIQNKLFLTLFLFLSHCLVYGGNLWTECLAGSERQTLAEVLASSPSNKVVIHVIHAIIILNDKRFKL